MNFKNLILSTSVLVSLINPSLATKKLTEDLADRETNQEAIITKLTGSTDFTFTLDVDREAETIKDAVVALEKNRRGNQKPTAQELAEISFTAKRRMVNNLDRFKEHPVDLGNGYYTGRNFRNKLSTTSYRNPLAYPVFADHGDREEPNSFLPTTYQSNFVSKDLCEYLWYYATHCNRNITKEEAVKLTRYLQPIFYIVQQEVNKLLEGNENPYHRPRWVYGKDRDGIIASVKEQTEHHHLMTQNADKTKYYDVRDIEDRIVPLLVGKALDLIPLQLRELYNDGRHSFRIGRNYKGFASLIHPQIDNLPYPVLSNHRMNGGKVLSDMNLPVGYVAHPTITNQWNRVADFVMGDGRIAVDEKQNMIRLLEPVGYLFRHAVQSLRILADQYPEREEAIERLTGLAMTYATTHNIPEDVLNVFYNGRVNLHTLLQDMKVKSARHEGMVSDLIPVGLRGGLENVRNNLLEALVFHDMVDRFKLFYPYDVHRLG